MADAKMIGVEKVKARFAKLSERLKSDVGSQLAKEVEDMTEAMQRAAPVSSDLEAHPGQFRDSIHFYPNPDRPLSYRIIADARDDRGEFIGPHIEFGHKGRDGAHVPAVPSFFPTYRARKKPMRRRLSAAARKSVKAIFPE